MFLIWGEIWVFESWLWAVNSLFLRATLHHSRVPGSRSSVQVVRAGAADGGWDGIRGSLHQAHVCWSHCVPVWLHQHTERSAPAARPRADGAVRVLRSGASRPSSQPAVQPAWLVLHTRPAARRRPHSRWTHSPVYFMLDNFNTDGPIKCFIRKTGNSGRKSGYSLRAMV